MVWITEKVTIWAHRIWVTPWAGDSVTGTQTDSDTGTQTDSDTGTQTDSDTGKQTDSDTGTQTDSDTGMQTDFITRTTTVYVTETETVGATETETLCKTRWAEDDKFWRTTWNLQRVRSSFHVQETEKTRVMPTAISLANASELSETRDPVRLASYQAGCRRFHTYRNRTTNDGGGSPVFFHVGEDSWLPEYVSGGIDGGCLCVCFLDTSTDESASAAGQMALVSSGGHVYLFDEMGMHQFHAKCTIYSSAAADYLLQKLAVLIGTSQRPSSNFTVAIQVDDMVGGRLLDPYLGVGPSPCTFVSRQPTDDGQGSTLTWNCEYPGVDLFAQFCESFLRARFSPSPETFRLVSTFIDGPVNCTEKALNLIPRILREAKAADSESWQYTLYKMFKFAAKCYHFGESLIP
ncbi:hypothetical protein QBC47DRAFT_62404 [Echria macrotheca]|uniref:Uncharacterized protein n=1 Tax=Echria macrotheca TaxID=438768 RepID=A0AAJ0B6R1_9PEZI|nr:hypothetical protein QBC47DRAFT_62404 [Echria macrotheca]